jgi:hypothetical protein
VHKINGHRPADILYQLGQVNARLFNHSVHLSREGAGGALTGGAGTVRITEATLRRVKYGYGGKTYAFGTPAVLALSLGVGVIGGIYSIGGGSIIAPFLVIVFGLPVYTVAGTTLIGTFVTSLTGVAFYKLLAATRFGAEMSIALDWLLGLTLGSVGWPGPTRGRGCRGTCPSG